MMSEIKSIEVNWITLSEDNLPPTKKELQHVERKSVAGAR